VKCSFIGAAFLACASTAAQAQQVDLRLLSCIAHIVYGEAGNQPIKGKYWVAWSLIFRAAANKAYFGGSDICDVAYKYTAFANRHEYDGAKSMPKDDPAMEESVYVAYHTLLGEEQPPVPVMYFCAPRSCGWHDSDRNLAYVGTIKGHRFYVDRRFSIAAQASAPGS
jgi:hypothetical protein